MTTTNNRTPNWKLPNLISTYQDFSNYNHTIWASNSESIYLIRHWSTIVLTLDTTTNKIIHLETKSISQTTSTLVGRILRALPRATVLDYLATAPIDTATKRRLSKMLWH
jgi:hypothetical protein